VLPSVTVALFGFTVIEGVTDAPAPVIATVTIWVDTPGASGTLAVLARVEVG